MSARTGVRRLLPYLVAVASGFLIGYLLIFLFVFPTEVVPVETKVPNVSGFTYDDAVAQLRKVGFDAAQGETRYHATAPKGTVLEQDPPTGTVLPRNSRVTLAVSAGQRRGRVPVVLGMTRERAQMLLENAGFDVGSVEEQPSERPRGEVIATAPGADVEAPLPSTVTMFVSAGPANISVPDVVGRPFAEARSMLEQLGLQVPTATVDDLAPEIANTVTSQTPPAGTIVAPRSAVQLTVSGRAP